MKEHLLDLLVWCLCFAVIGVGVYKWQRPRYAFIKCEVRGLADGVTAEIFCK